LVSKLPAWKAVQEEKRKGRTPKKLKGVSLTGRVLATTPAATEATLDQLIAEQEADSEASPLDPSGRPRRVRRMP